MGPKQGFWKSAPESRLLIVVRTFATSVHVWCCFSALPFFIVISGVCVFVCVYIFFIFVFDGLGCCYCCICLEEGLG